MAIGLPLWLLCVLLALLHVWDEVAAEEEPHQSVSLVLVVLLRLEGLPFHLGLLWVWILQVDCLPGWS